jgi:histone-lysine N-methyltransferase SETD2
MVIPVAGAMARRRKGVGGSKATAKSQTKASRKSNGLSVGRLNGSLLPPSTNESEESCVSQDDNLTSLSCLTPIEMCPTDPPPLTVFKINASPQHVPLVHKKFRKFRHMLEPGDVQESQNCVAASDKVEPHVTETVQVLESHRKGNVEEVGIEQQAIDMTEAQEVPVVWEEEVVEETVVCEGMEVELEDTRSQDNSLMVEEVDSRGSEYDNMIEVRNDEFSSQDGRVIVVREDGYSHQYNQELMDVGDVLSNHRLMEFSSTQDTEKNVSHQVQEMLVFGNEDSQGTVRGVECSQGISVSVRGMEMDVQDGTRVLKPVVSEKVVDIIRGVKVDHKTVILQVPDSQITHIKEESDTGNCENIGHVAFIEENSQENKQVFRDIQINMDQNMVKILKDSACYIENNEMDLVDVRMKAEYQTGIGLGLNERNELETVQVPFDLGDEFTDRGSKLVGERNSLHKSQSEMKLESIVETSEVDTKVQSEEDMQEVSHDQHLALKCNEDETERKQVPIFRSRSGSTDTTGSESSSNCSSGVRRSSRIRSIGIMKQRAQNRSDAVETSATVNEKEGNETKIYEGKDTLDSCSGIDTQSDKENVGVTKIPLPMSSPATLHGLVTPAIPGYDVDSCKPVKVKSRWRRSSELEMVGSRSSDSELAVTPPTPNLSPRPIVPVASSLSPQPAASATSHHPVQPLIPSNIPSTAITPLEQAISGDAPKKDIRSDRNDRKEREDKEMEERLRNFDRLIENEYLTER